MTYNEELIAALSLAIADVLSHERFRMIMLIRLLEKKGVVTETELLEAFEKELSSAPGPPKLIRDERRAIQTEIETRMTAHLREIRARDKPLN